jgi:adenine phosphoribosyltransferase
MEDSMIDFKDYIEDVQDFPIEGITYRDIQPLLEDEEVFYDSIYELGQFVDMEEVDYFVGIESRGFIFASALASINLKPFKMIRKEGKLPDRNHVLHQVEYDLEYGSATIEMKPGKGKVVLVDDVYATGGTMEAAEELCKMSGYEVIGKLCLVDIGIKKDHDIKCLISYAE